MRLLLQGIGVASVVVGITLVRVPVIGPFLMLGLVVFGATAMGYSISRPNSRP